METFLQIAPHSLALVMSRIGAKEDSPAATQKHHHHLGYEIFADFKAVNMEQFWNKKVTEAIKDTFFLGWIDEHVLLIQGKEDHLEVLREAWSRRALKPPAGFDIKFIGTVVGYMKHTACLKVFILSLVCLYKRLYPCVKSMHIFSS